MSVSEETLIAYVDGELDGAERATLEAALAGDVGLRARVEKHRALRTKLSAAFDDVLNEPVPERLRAAAEATPRAAEVVSLADRRAAKATWSYREWGAMAASLAGGLIIGLGAMSNNGSMIAQGDGGLVARGSLAQALNTQLASDDGSAVRIGLSFRDQQGSYCRTFDAQGTAGLACRSNDGWNVAMTAASAPTGEVRMAGADAAILDAVDQMIDGEPLDAQAEARAREAGWR